MLVSVRMRSLLHLLVGVTLASAGVASARAQNHVGAARCKDCHAFEFEVWSKGPHASAHRALDAEQAKDAKCNGCHTLVPLDESPKFAGVQCESCHGAGRYYLPAFVMKDSELARAVGLIDPTEAVCQRCHTEAAPSIRPFDFATMWARIDHGRAAREAWEKARAASRHEQATKQTPAAKAALKPK